MSFRQRRTAITPTSNEAKTLIASAKRDELVKTIEEVFKQTSSELKLEDDFRLPPFRFKQNKIARKRVPYVVVKVIRAKNLKAADADAKLYVKNLIRKNKVNVNTSSDPYVKVYLAQKNLLPNNTLEITTGDQKKDAESAITEIRMTPKINKTLDPDWSLDGTPEQVFCFRINKPEHLHQVVLRLDLFDHDSSTEHDPLGFVQMPLASFAYENLEDEYQFTAHPINDPDAAKEERNPTITFMLGVKYFLEHLQQPTFSSTQQH